MEGTFEAGAADPVKIKFKKKQEADANKRNDQRAIWLVAAFVLLLFLVIGGLNYQRGGLFTVPQSITYKNAVYLTEGEIVTGDSLARTGDKVGNLEVYVKEAAPGKPNPLPAQQIYVKAEEDYIVYFLEEER